MSLSNSRYLCWNLIGSVIVREESNFKAIDISFADISNKKKLTFIDTNNLCLGILNNCGAFLASKIDETNPDEYEKEGAKKTAVIEFKTIYTLSNMKNWQMELPTEEV